METLRQAGHAARLARRRTPVARDLVDTAIGCVACMPLLRAKQNEPEEFERELPPMLSPLLAVPLGSSQLLAKAWENAYLNWLEAPTLHAKSALPASALGQSTPGGGTRETEG